MSFLEFRIQSKSYFFVQPWHKNESRRSIWSVGITDENKNYLYRVVHTHNTGLPERNKKIFGPSGSNYYNAKDNPGIHFMILDRYNGRDLFFKADLSRLPYFYFLEGGGIEIRYPFKELTEEQYYNF